MEHDIGYMQVQMRLYMNGNLYDTFAMNAFDGCFCVKTNLISTHHEVVVDKAKVYDKIFQIKINVTESDYTIIMHMPIHQSKDWEVLRMDDIYSVAFFCNLGKT